MKTSSSAPLYDLFKLIVALILALLFLVLMFWMPPAPPPPTPSPSSTPATAQATPTNIPVTPSATPTSTSVPPTPTFTPSATLSATDTPTAVGTEKPTLTPTATPVVDNPPGETCPAASRSQLKVGMKAVILHRLNFRSSPGIANNLLRTNPPGTQVEVIGGSTCLLNANGGSYLWWQIKLPDGSVGWSAEASAFGGFYFMKPLP